MQDPLVYLNGSMTPLSEARISPILDRGFIFGDGVYKVILIDARKLFCADPLSGAPVPPSGENQYSKSA